MGERPPLGARVRFLANTSLPGVAGRTGEVVGHHGDGIAFVVRLEGDDQRSVTCDPVNVRELRRRRHEVSQ